MQPSTACTQAHASYLLLSPCMPCDLLPAPVPPQQTIQGDARWKGLWSAVSTPPSSHRHRPGADSPALPPKPGSGFSFPDVSRGAQRQTLERGVSQLSPLFHLSIWFFLFANPPLIPANSTLRHPQPTQPSPPPCLRVDGSGDSPGLLFLLHQPQASFRDSS